MRKRTLNINEVDVTGKPVLYTCHGLGPCIALFITDRLKGVSGGAHIPLPSSLSGSDFLDAASMIDALLCSFAQLGSDLKFLVAKLTGGAQVYASSANIGEHNALVVLQQLANKKIFIAASDVGGSIPRTARFNSITRELEISTPGLKKYCI